MKSKWIVIMSFLSLVSCADADNKQQENIVVKTEAVEDIKQIPDGEFIKKYPNGAIQIKGLMKNNERNGLWVAYYENGVKQSESTYKNGVLHGRTASFYTNGQVRYIGYFLGGNKDGKWDFYSEEGDFDKSEVYEKGILAKDK